VKNQTKKEKKKMSRNYPDPGMQSLLTAARRYSESTSSDNGDTREYTNGGGRYNNRATPDHLRSYSNSRPNSRTELLLENKKPSYIDNLNIMDDQKRRLSEAGVNRRPSAAHVLTEDTDSFIIGMRVFVDGVKPGRIQFIGETKFGPGEWAGVFLDEPIGKNDGSVMNTRYFTCEPRHGVFSRLYRLTQEQIEGAEEIMNQCRRYGYEILDAPTDRRGSTSGNSRRGSMDRGSLSPRRGSTPESRSPRRTPEPFGRGSPESNGRRGSIGLTDRRNSHGLPARKFTPSKSPLASPHNYKHTSNSSLSGSPRIDKDPDIERLANEARRLSMGGAALADRRGSSAAPDEGILNRRASENRLGLKNGNGYTKHPSSVSPRLGMQRRRESEQLMENGRRSSESFYDNNRASPIPSHVCNSHKPPSFSRKQSEHLNLERRGSYSDATHSSMQRQRENSLSRRGSGAGFERRESYGYNSLPRRGSAAGSERRGSSARRQSEDIDPAELQRRRMSEAGLRRKSATDVVLNDNTEMLMVGQEVWVDGNKRGRIAYIGSVHFAKGEMAGVHLDEPIGKNNGTIGGRLYFQTEPRHGLFSRLHRLSLRPMSDQDRYEG